MDGDHSLRPAELRWQLTANAPIQRCWRLLSDTDRFNRVANFKHQFEDKLLPQGGVESTGRDWHAGIPLKWTESPHTWQAPERFRIHRTFIGGPAREYTVDLALSADGDSKTKITYLVRVWPRVALLRPVVLADLRMFVRSGIDKALRRAVSYLNGDIKHFDDPPPKLSIRADKRLRLGLANLQSTELRQRIYKMIGNMPLHLQQKLNPLKLAVAWKAEPEETLSAFIEAVNHGVLRLNWSLRCPSCRTNIVELPRLTAGPEERHCDSCNLPFDGSMPDNLVATFQPDPSIRPLSVSRRCVGSAGRTPHVLFQRDLKPMTRVKLTLPLLAGGYRIRTIPSTSTISLQIREDVESRAVAVQIRPESSFPGLLRARPGHVEFDLAVRQEVPTTWILERVFNDTKELTAGRLLESERIRKMVPPGLMHPDLRINVVRSVLLAARVERGGVAARDLVKERVAAWKPLHMVARGNTVLAAFDSSDNALRAASVLDGCDFAGAALCAGMVVFREQADAVVPCGGAADMAVLLADRAPAGHVLFEPAVAADLEFTQSLARPGVEVVTASDKTYLKLSHPVRVAPPLAFTPPCTKPSSGMLIDDQYRLGEKIADGGFGSTWSATRLSGERVVIKMMHPNLLQDAMEVQRFFNEGRVLRDLDCPNIVSVYDHGRDAGGYMFIAMEQLHGQDLWQLLRDRRQLPPREVALMGVDLLRGLHSAHQAGLVHRDIKPGNVFIHHHEGRRTAVLIDFGVALPLDVDVTGVSTAKFVLGTPHYMAPEQAAGDPINGQADLFALGCAMFEALTGQLPFRGDTAVQLMVSRMNEDAPRLTQVAFEVHPGLDEFMARMLARDLGHRYQSAEEALEALLKVVGDLDMQQPLALNPRAPGLA